MASLRNHKVVEVWKRKDSDMRYHLTANDRVLRTCGPRGGGAKLLYTNDDGKTFRITSGLRRATATEWKANSQFFQLCEREL